jgi:flagellar hook-length control protein FliK
MLPPLNLLALDSATLETDLKTWQRVQGEGTAFDATFADVLQLPIATSPGLANRPPDAAAFLLSPPADGRSLPADGNALPPTEGAEPLDGEAALAGLFLPIAPSGKPAPPAGRVTADAASAAITVTAAGTGSAHQPVTPAAVTLPAAKLMRADGQADVAPPALSRQMRYFGPATDVSAPAVTDAMTVEAASEARRLGSLRSSTANPALLALRQIAAPVPVAEPVPIGAATPSIAPSIAWDAALQVDMPDLRQAAPQAPTVAAAPLPQAPASLPQAPAPETMSQWVTSQIGTPPGQPGWNEALGDRVMWMAGNRIQNAELRLNPSELGPVRVQISIDDGQATVSFTAQHPLTRDAIEQALPRLREMLADQGLVLQGTSVTEQGARHEQYQAGRQGNAARFESGEGVPDGRSEDAVLSTTGRPRAGLVDTFA